jgi:hypothetical protein
LALSAFSQARASCGIKKLEIKWGYFWGFFRHGMAILNEIAIARDVFIGDVQLRASSSCASPKKIFIGAHGQEF